MMRCVLLAVAMAAAVDVDVDVLTTHGPVQGLLDEQLQIRSFLGVPYGRVGPENRFKAPQKPEAWTTILETKQFTKECPQYNNNEYTGEEDCLVLNVFTPAAAADGEEGEGAALPVLVHVHGGELQHGSGTPAVYGPQRLVPRGVVLVVPNYRLGALGFMCLRSELAPGNAGLKDLALALEWVRDNIRAFGGSPTNVTVSGDGAGGAAAGLLAVAPHTRGLIGRVISESGSVLSPWTVDRNPVARGSDLAAFLAGQTRDDSSPNVLLEVDVGVIVSAAAMRGDIFRPCIESLTNNSDAFLTAPPYHLMRQNENVSVAFMIGYANGAGMPDAAAQTAASVAMIETDPASLLPDDLVFGSASTRDATAERIRKQYFGDEGASIEKLDEFVRYYTDAYFLGPALRAAVLHSVASPMYFYEFGYDGDLNYAKRKLVGAERLEGAARRDIVGYVFVQADQPTDIAAEDALMADTITSLWSSFIETGSPALPSEESSWPPLTGDQQHFLNISDSPHSARDVHPERLALWDELYAAHYVDCPSTGSRRIDAHTLLSTFAFLFTLTTYFCMVNN